jgi:hypothetical protein
VQAGIVGHRGNTSPPRRSVRLRGLPWTFGNRKPDKRKAAGPKNLWSHLQIRLLFAIVLLGLGACGDDPTQPDPAPSFAINVSGDITRMLEGEGATFVATADVNLGPAWRLDLQRGTGPALEAVEFLRLDTRPGIGTYPLSDASLPNLVPPGEFGAFVILSIDGSQPGFLGSATSGSITIAASTAEVVRGSFTFEAAGNLFPQGGSAQPGTLTVSGEFEAVPGTLTAGASFHPRGSPTPRASRALRGDRRGL